MNYSQYWTPFLGKIAGKRLRDPVKPAQLWSCYNSGSWSTSHSWNSKHGELNWRFTFFCLLLYSIDKNLNELSTQRDKLAVEKSVTLRLHNPLYVSFFIWSPFSGKPNHSCFGDKSLCEIIFFYIMVVSALLFLQISNFNTLRSKTWPQSSCCPPKCRSRLEYGYGWGFFQCSPFDSECSELASWFARNCVLSVKRGIQETVKMLLIINV